MESAYCGVRTGYLNKRDKKEVRFHPYRVKILLHKKYAFCSAVISLSLWSENPNGQEDWEDVQVNLTIILYYMGLKELGCHCGMDSDALG